MLLYRVTLGRWKSDTFKVYEVRSSLRWLTTWCALIRPPICGLICWGSTLRPQYRALVFCDRYQTGPAMLFSQIWFSYFVTYFGWVLHSKFNFSTLNVTVQTRLRFHRRHSSVPLALRNMILVVLKIYFALRLRRELCFFRGASATQVWLVADFFLRHL